jgi:hypothetical protein
MGILAMQGDGAASGGNGHGGVEPVVALLQPLPAGGDPREQDRGLQLWAADSCHPPRRVLLPKRAVTPLLHEALSWRGFQLEEQPLSCQDAPA